MAEAENTLAKPRRHLLIAGTGRSGTSFLVRFLAAMGLDTNLAKSGEEQWNSEANAGLEDIPLTSAFNDLPYVVKNPFLSEIIDTVLSDPGILIEAVIIPVRDLTEAAASRTIVELQAVHQLEPWMIELDHMVETWGSTPGGVVYSLNPLDQARLLAVGFHRLIERLTVADVPMVFLDFPRLVNDPSYLFAKLRPFLPADSTEAQAKAAHAEVADATKVRVREELRDAASSQAAMKIHVGPGYPQRDTQDLIALRRELAQLRARSGGTGISQNQRLLGDREFAMGQRETQMAEREQHLQQYAAALERQARNMSEQKSTSPEQIPAKLTETTPPKPGRTSALKRVLRSVLHSRKTRSLKD
jgi:hypothetical protein